MILIDGEKLVENLEELRENNCGHLIEVDNVIETMQNYIENENNRVKVPGWIPCSDRLPRNIANRVICFCYGEDTADWIGFGHCEIKDGHAIWLNLESELPFEAWGLTVTHWMPLPEPPKEGAENG